MATLLLTALTALTAVVVLGVLADSGLRWWSAFGQLRAEMAGARRAALPGHRAVMSCSAFDRRTAGLRAASRGSAIRVAA